MCNKKVWCLILVIISMFVTSTLFAILPIAEEYIFSDKVCGEYNTDIKQHLNGHSEYFYRVDGSTYTNRGCDWAPNQTLPGVVYAYGHSDFPSTFKNEIDAGLGAGNHSEHYYRIPTGADPSWTTGIDCTGFVCNIWGISQVPTWNWGAIAYKVPRWDAQPLDSLLLPAGHVRLYEAGDLESGNDATYYEASPTQNQVWENTDDCSQYILYRHGHDNTAPSIDSIDIVPNPFSPNGDGIDDTSTLTFNITDTQCGAVSLRLYINNQLVHTFPDSCSDGVKLMHNGSQYKQSFSWAWDGKINGTLQPSGSYPLKMEVEDLNGNKKTDTLHPLPKEILCFLVPVDNSTNSNICYSRQGITYACC